MTGDRIYLVRHAKAEQARDDDAGRRLSPQGRARFERLLRALGARLEVGRILTSPLVRARETAELLSRATGAPVEEDPRLASGASSGEELLALVREAPARTALVGHNPEVAEALALAAGRDVEVPTGAVAALAHRQARGGRSELTLEWLEAPVR